MLNNTLMIDIEGLSLTEDDKKILSHPYVGGVILFTRNYKNIEQLIKLTHEIHALKNPSLLIAVDHEGGRIQRFQKGFTHLPSMRELGKLYDRDSQEAVTLSEKTGFTLGSELRAVGIDCSFAPVLDIDANISTVIGDRSFHQDPDSIIPLAIALITGMKKAGILSVGKHFPGHGHVAADSHIDIPVDSRPFDVIEKIDLKPFKALIHAGIPGIMPAHVIYKAVDPAPAGFSHFWLHDILRKKLGFKGIIFSDDLCMAGASPMGNIIERVTKAKNAGCDILLICNNRDFVKEVLNHG